MFYKFLFYSFLLKFTDAFETDDNSWIQFNQFQKRFNKLYTTLDEFEKRFSIFKMNLRTIIEHNSNPNQNFTMSINPFTDLTPEEFKIQYASGYKPLQSYGCVSYTNHGSDLPTQLDWVSKGVVQSVRDQGQCGSCWAFATTANAESVWAISTGELPDLSEQYLVDCATGFGYFNMGCNGGQPDSALKYMINKGQCSEYTYPYTAKQGNCDVCSQPSDVTFSSCYDVKSNDQLSLKNAVLKNPVVVAIEADTKYFQSYSSGILTESIKCGTNLDHAVEIVGYGSENGIKYWKVRNSWSSSWGEDGYVRIERSDSTNDPGVCGIAMEPSFISI